MNKFCCSNCRYYRAKYMACFRFPPTAIFNSALYAYESVHPPIAVPDVDICGEWKREKDKNE